MKKEAMCYRRLDKGNVQCFLCSHLCVISPGSFGRCGVRENNGGRLYTNAYGELVAKKTDPVEKKPLYHFLPGTSAFSIATLGCNFKCDFCQNWQISQNAPEEGLSLGQISMAPRDIVEEAVQARCSSIAYTYTEPTIFYEYAYDTAEKALARNLANIFVTNGFMTAEALDTVGPYLDACNVDLKSFNNDFYRKKCGGRLKPVIESIRYMKELGIWIEITTLVIPDMNDSDDELRSLARFIAETDRNIPWHISRFYPDYKADNGQVTPIETIERARNIGKEEGLKFIYAGNVGTSEHTCCPECGNVLISREYGVAHENRIKDGACPGCGTRIPGVWQKKCTAYEVTIGLPG